MSSLVLPSNIIECIAAQCDSLRDVYTLCLLNKQWNRAIKRSALVLCRWSHRLNAQLPPELQFPRRLPCFVNPEWGSSDFLQAIEHPCMLRVVVIGGILFYGHAVAISSIQISTKGEFPIWLLVASLHWKTLPEWCVRVNNDDIWFWLKDGAIGRKKQGCWLGYIGLSTLLLNYNHYIDER